MNHPSVERCFTLDPSTHQYAGTADGICAATNLVAAAAAATADATRAA